MGMGMGMETGRGRTISSWLSPSFFPMSLLDQSSLDEPPSLDCMPGMTRGILAAIEIEAETENFLSAVCSARNGSVVLGEIVATFRGGFEVVYIQYVRESCGSESRERGRRLFMLPP